MLLLTSCIHQEDTFVEALTLQNQTSSETTGTTETPTTGTTTGTTSGAVKLSSPSAISTEALNAIKNVKLKIDLTLSSNANLLKVGGYLSQSGIVVAQSATGVLVAATQTCTHEPKKQVIFNKTEFYCTAHGARFSLTGAGLNSLGSRGIAVYKVATDGNTVVVY